MTTTNKILGAALTAMVLLCGGCPGIDDGDGGWGCGSSNANQTEATIYVSDSKTGQPIAMPVFAEEGQTLVARCGEEEDTYPPQCLAQVLTLSAADHSIVVSAAGYFPQTVDVDTSATQSVHLAVELVARDVLAAERAL